MTSGDVLDVSDRQESEHQFRNHQISPSEKTNEIQRKLRSVGRFKGNLRRSPTERGTVLNSVLGVLGTTGPTKEQENTKESRRMIHGCQQNMRTSSHKNVFENQTPSTFSTENLNTINPVELQWTLIKAKKIAKK